MRLPLASCTITGALRNPASGFAAAAASLLYQSNALGMRFDAIERASTDRGISFSLHTPATSPVTCDITGWADASASLATEHIVQAASGLMSVHGRASGQAQALGVNYVSTLAAALGLQAAIAAAVGQLRGASVAHTTVSLASAALLSVGQYIAGATAPQSPEKILPGSTSTQDRPPFTSLDGVVFELETLDAEPWRTFWAEVGVDADTAGKGWKGFLLRYAKAIAPLPAQLTAALSRLPYAHIAAICARTGMSICALRSLGERARDDDAQDMWRQGPWTFVSGQSQHNASPGRSAADLPLSGLTVIESCRRIQGPLAGHLLALLGADVIRIEPPGGDPLRGMPPMAQGVSARFDALNRYKTVREIDIKSVRGQADIHELARHADVFLHNWAPGKAALLHLDHADLARINPALIYAYAGGWGNAVRHDLPGTDFMAQAYSGVGKKIAGASGTAGGSLFTVLDVLGGVVAAQGITVALLARCMNHAGVKVESSLLGAATLLCADELHAQLHPDATTCAPESIIKAVYSTRQGLIAIECCDTKTALRLAGILGLSNAADLHSRLSGILLSKSAAEWLAVLEQGGIPAAIVIEDLADLHKEQRISACLSVASGTGSYTRVNSPWRFK